MSIFVTKKHSLTLIVTLTLLLSVTLMLPKSTSAASKEYEVYKKIKIGMTVTSFAKVVYGKKYKDHLKKEKGITVLKRTPEFKDFQKDHSYYIHFFYGTYNKKYKRTDYKMAIDFKTKSNGKTLYVVGRSYDTLGESGQYFLKRSKIKKGMSIPELDKYISGKGLTKWSIHSQFDFSKVGYFDGKKTTYPPKETYLHFLIKDKSAKETIQLILEYNYKKKKYLLTEFY